MITDDGLPRYWFVFYENKLLLNNIDDVYSVPMQAVAPVASISESDVHYVATSNGVECVAVRVDREIVDNDGFCMIDLMSAYSYVDHAVYKIAGKSYEILHWDSTSRYCSACGARTVRTTPITKQCSVCGREMYPNISAAVLVMIRKGDSILLAQSANRAKDSYGLVAGFLESGERLEECVAREVEEETGLQVDNITYYGNQEWPYPSGLMVGFVADYKSGEIELRDHELISAAFFRRDELPQKLPREVSLARKMINWWLAGGDVCGSRVTVPSGTRD